MNYDIIGDIHGHADELEVLLKKLNYRKQGGIYEHPDDRKVIFLGDFIDRGPQIRRVLHIVKDMMDAGNAEAIMGNHEFNAIAFHTPNLNANEGGFYRKHNYKEIHQHLATLEQFHKFQSEWTDFLSWFKSLPIFIEKDNFKAVHACWDQAHVNWLRENFNGFDDDFLRGSTTKNTDSYWVIEELLKGKEERLPEGHSFFDKDGHERRHCRLKWWQPLEKRRILGDVMMACPDSLSEDLITKEYYDYQDNKTVFFGHYWLKGLPKLENRNAICLDYSVAKGGVLAAYRTEYLESATPENGFVF
ncbi:MAG: metallophosphoesterase [Flavobacteriia bacterium]